MKNFMGFMKHSYNSYFILDQYGEYRSVTREECFAPSYDKRQRWYWDDEQRTVAVRLPLTEHGLKLANAHLTPLKKEARDQIAKLQCVAFGTTQCRTSCGNCDNHFECRSKQKQSNGRKCRRKCRDCSCYTSQTVELDRTIESTNGDFYAPYEPGYEDDTQRRLEVQAVSEVLAVALEVLTETQQELVRDIFKNKLTERQIADKLGLKSSKTVNYRKHIILEILRGNDSLKEIIQNDL